MKNRFLLSTCLVLSSLLAFIPAQAKELKMAYDADPVTLDIHEQLSGGVLVAQVPGQGTGGKEPDDQRKTDGKTQAL